MKDGRDLFCHVRDARRRAMCKLAGKDPAEFGFPPFTATKHTKGKPMLLASASKVGFTSKADRLIAFEKAATWLKSFEPPAVPLANPEPEKLMKQQGDPDFKAYLDLGVKALSEWLAEQKSK